MPKIKTKKGAAKRFKVTKKGKFKYSKSKRRHILEHKSAKKSREMRESSYVDKTDAPRMRQMMPYA